MLRTSFSVMALLMVAFSVAGCTAPEASAPGETKTTPEAPSAFVGTGDLRIDVTVTDDSLVPIKDALVELLEAKAQVRTDPVGQATLSGVAPGKYTLNVAHTAFHPASQIVTLHDADLAVVIQLFPIGVVQPYHETVIKDGFVGCSVAVRAGTLSPSAAICGNAQVAGLDNLDQFVTDWRDVNFTQDFIGAWGETTFTSGQALSNEMRVAWLWGRPSETGTGFHVNSSSGADPIRVRLSVEEFGEAKTEAGDACASAACGLAAAHFAATASSQSADVVVMLQQRYSDYLTLFHVEGFPDHFSALPDA